jgi:hypothetical protein
MKQLNQALGFALVTAALVAGARPAAAQGLVFDIYNTGGVTDRLAGPPNQTWFGTFNKSAAVTQVATYHWHNGQGAPASTITLRGNNGRTYGPYPTTAGINHVAVVNTTVPAGIYVIIDSDPATWSYNGQPPSNGSGFARVFGTFVNPAPAAPAPRPTTPAMQSFGSPALNGFSVGQCYKGTGQLGNGLDCGGKTSADTFCRAEGYASAVVFKPQVLSWPRTTRALGDGAVCTAQASRPGYTNCFGFEYITCTK